jgi:hypothetical protein
MIRANRGRAWFHANWGYEEAKHSLALGDWLLRSGARSEEQMADLEHAVFEHEWNLPHDNGIGMVLYGMIQELATWLNYRNLRHRVDEYWASSRQGISGAHLSGCHCYSSAAHCACTASWGPSPVTSLPRPHPFRKIRSTIWQKKPKRGSKQLPLPSARDYLPGKP